MLSIPEPPSPAVSGASPTLYGRLERLSLAAGALIMLSIVAASAFIAARTDHDLGDAARAQLARATTVDLLQAVSRRKPASAAFC